MFYHHFDCILECFYHFFDGFECFFNIFRGKKCAFESFFRGKKCDYGTFLHNKRDQLGDQSLLRCYETTMIELNKVYFRDFIYMVNNEELVDAYVKKVESGILD